MQGVETKKADFGEEVGFSLCTKNYLVAVGAVAALEAAGLVSLQPTAQRLTIQSAIAMIFFMGELPSIRGNKHIQDEHHPERETYRDVTWAE